MATLRQNNVGIGVLSSAPGDTVAEARRKQLQQKIGIPFDPCLFATHLDKGEVLHAFLKKITPGTYQHIVFIDDLAPNIALTAKMVAQHGITFTGIWYCADILASLPIPSEEEVESLAQEFWCAQQDSNLRPTD
ncbi:MAG: DUF2608 domain-containing protein [Candidatus Babeliaceae bacterium]|nr:DUF2608 domain-containing protein [Candidatus Babeliaceae bacterium]